MDERVAQELSAYLDGELGPDARARVEALLASSTEARVTLDRLAAGRDAVRSGATAPHAAEIAALDAAVLSAGSNEQMEPAASRRISPRKRGRPPWPYFAAAASFAVVLSLGIVVLAQVFGHNSSRDTAAVATTAASPPSAAATPSSLPTQADRVAPAPVAEQVGPRGSSRSGAAVSPSGLPELFLSGVAVNDAAGLAGLATDSPAATTSRDEAVRYLVELASGSRTDEPALARCLEATAPAVPVRVDVGTFGGAPAFLVVLAPPGSPPNAVVALATSDCTTLATAPLSR